MLSTQGSAVAASEGEAVQANVGIGPEVMPTLALPSVSAPPVPGSAIIRLALPPLSPEDRREQQRMQSGGGPLRLGLGRNLSDHQGTLPARQRRRWSPTIGGGHVLGWQLRSPGAVGLRLGVRLGQAPDDIRLRVSTPGHQASPPISGAEIHASIHRNRDAGGDDDAARLFWLPLVIGDSLLLQVELPAGVQPANIHLELVRVSHFFRLPFLESSTKPPARPDPATDPACAEQWDAPSRAATLLLYTHPDGATGACTGTLLNDSDPQTFIPYLITAHHCFSDQVRASSIESLWFVRGETCGGGLPTYGTVSGVADLLYLAHFTDTALLRLRRPPPQGAVFIGWRPTLPSKGAQVVGIHHPAGNPQQRTAAVVTEYKNCEEVDYCGREYDPDAVHFVRVHRRAGSTRPGSSGSGLFNTSQQLIGTLLGGSDADDPDGFDYYGRFDRPYRDGMQRWLGVGGSGE